MRYLLPALLIVLAPRAALACPVCFGQNDSAMAVAINTGVLLMLGVVVAVLGAFASFFIYLVRRASLAEDGPDASRTNVGSRPQEGTARC
jgi:Na+-transporting NADH:ubiquinone oxidoreductase subunit NqrD